MTDILHRVINEAAAAAGCSPDDLIVLNLEMDPYGLHTPSAHRNGAWVAAQIELLTIDYLTFFWRGLHYALVAHGNTRKPDRAIYANSVADWESLQTAAKLGLRHGYVPGYLPQERHDRVVKFRSNESNPAQPPTAGLNGSVYARAIFSNKPWLYETLRPIAERCRADLILSSGERNDMFVHGMAADAFGSGRPLVVFTCVDCSPTGVQATVLIARMLQALRDLEFPGLQFAIHEVAVTPEQVKTLGLPPIPLKSSERPDDKWKAAYGIEQTEIDALAALHPKALEETLVEAIDPYSDASLDCLDRLARHHTNSAEPLFCGGGLISTDVPWLEQTQALIRRLGR